VAPVLPIDQMAGGAELDRLARQDPVVRLKAPHVPADATFLCVAVPVDVPLRLLLRQLRSNEHELCGLSVRPDSSNTCR
jgi:hypothetical protein